MALVTGILLAVFVLPSPWGVVAIFAGGLVEAGESLFWIRWSQRRRAHVGAEALIGATATVTSACMPMGQVRVRGELWRARCDVGAEVGARVRIVALEELTLVVEPL